MQNSLRDQIITILKESKNEVSVEAEASLILFYLLKKTEHPIQSLAELNLKSSNEGFHQISADALRIARERMMGLPLQHLLGFQYFLSQDYIVNENVLIPRPETEILVQEAINWITEALNNKRMIPNFKFAELGLGSGIISNEILSLFPFATATASEASEAALKIARLNLNQNNLRINILVPDSTETGFEIFLPQAPYDFIISNPPYVSVSDEIEKQVFDHEPHLALFPKMNPNYFYENFSYHYKELLKPGGSAFFEIPHERSSEITALFKRSGLKYKIVHDLTNRPRAVQVYWTL
jgi:release factor glutamine methyltransferase